MTRPTFTAIWMVYFKKWFGRTVLYSQLLRGLRENTRAAGIQLLGLSYLSLVSSPIFWRRNIAFIINHHTLLSSNFEQQHHEGHLATEMTINPLTGTHPLHSTSTRQLALGCSQIIELCLTLMPTNIQMTHSDLFWKWHLSVHLLLRLELCLAMAGSDCCLRRSERLQVCCKANRERNSKFRRGSILLSQTSHYPNDLLHICCIIYYVHFTHTCKEHEPVALL